MKEEMTNNEERLLAFFSHASIVVFGPGILVGLIIWLTQKEKSAFAARQGMQAALYQLLGMILTAGLWVVWGIFYALTWIPIARNPGQFEDAPPPIFWIGLISMVIPLLVMVVWGLYGLWGAIQSLRGRDFRYMVIGKLLAGED